MIDKEQEFASDNPERKERADGASTERLLRTADFITESVELIYALESDRPPDVSKQTFIFYANELDGVALPAAVESLLVAYNLIEIEIECSLSHPGERPDISYRFVLHLDDGGKEIVVTCERPGDLDLALIPRLDTITETYDSEPNDAIPIAQVSSAELTLCVASLVFPNKTSAYPDEFKDLDLQDASLHDTLTGSLQKHAHSYENEIIYEFYTADGTSAGYLQYSSSEGSVYYIEMHNVVNAELGIRSNGQLVDYRRTIATQMDLYESGFSLNYYITDGTNGTPSPSKPFLPENDDEADNNIQVQRDFIKAQLKSCSREADVPYQETFEQ